MLKAITIAILARLSLPTVGLDPCVPGICCEAVRAGPGGTTWYLDCSASTTGGCPGGASYLSCDAGSCYSGDETCHVGPSFNECCV